ncbi:nicotinamide-nucleotide amidohydrolase family protein [Epidermidibacterium keratini]|uniref:Nicotinamide-nucleotide amidohydrolase family protein n=1 Tax=Epidermidibacterium keratini TaxID=1891644 RepID=A0A7L4YS77_9ACTN|nr:CinA family protein [Epidermidibacterium keratini]QHC01912.1 nicotinamide-nucleotide amidohydrolase family protein [Epidermidibacterium keratini]
MLAEPVLQRAARVIAALQSAKQTVGTAESLTAGLCTATLTSIAGSSAVVRGGLVVYATDLKHSLAGVDLADLQSYGPVSEPVARQLASGARDRLGADWGLALTGVAGPGEQDGHRPGTVWIALEGPRERAVELLSLRGDRESIREQAVDGVLTLLERALE